MAGASAPTNQNGTGGTSGPSDGRTVHHPSPAGEGITSLHLTGQCLLRGLPVTPFPNPVRMQRQPALHSHVQPGEGVLHGLQDLQSISSLHLTGQCLPRGLLVTPLPNPARMQRQLALLTCIQPGEGFLHGLQDRKLGGNLQALSSGGWCANCIQLLNWFTTCRMCPRSRGHHSRA